MRGLQLLTNHCPRIAVSLLTALGLMMSGAASAQPAKSGAGVYRPEPGVADNIRNKVEENWILTPDLPGLKDVHAQVRVRLDRNGQIVGKPDVTTRGGPQKTQTSVAASVTRAVLRAAPFGNLPPAQFDNATSSVEVILNFELGDMAL
jgi:TonB C terminal